MRVGHGYTAFPLQPGNKMILGGVVLPGQHTLAGRGDGDVVLQSLCDALLGAAGLGDSATAFLSQQPDFQMASSRALLRLTRAKLGSLGYSTANIDISVSCPGISLQSKFEAMKGCIAEDMAISCDLVNIKQVASRTIPAFFNLDGAETLTTVLIQK